MKRAKPVQAVYDALGAHYDAMMRDPVESSWNHVLERPALAALLRSEIRGKAVADIGCGSGDFTAMLARWGAGAVTGVDFSKTLLGIARERYPEHSFRYGTATKTGLPARAFDVVVSSMMLHYLKNVRPHFREVRRMLRPGGVYVFSTHHPFFQARGDDPFRPHVSLQELRYLPRQPYQWKMMKTLRLHGYCHTFAQLADDLSREGFVIQRISEPTWKKKRGAPVPDEHALVSRLPPFLILKARRA